MFSLLESSNSAAAAPERDEATMRSVSPLVRRLPWYTDVVPFEEDLLRVVRTPNQFTVSFCLQLLFSLINTQFCRSQNFISALHNFEEFNLFSMSAPNGSEWRKYIHVKIVGTMVQPWHGLVGSTSDWTHSVSILCAYRLVDMIELLFNRPTGSILVGRTRLAKPPPKVWQLSLIFGVKLTNSQNMNFEALHDWRSILLNLRHQAESLQMPPENPSTNKTVSLFRSAPRNLRTSKIHSILANFDAAAGHISFLCHHLFMPGELPDLPSDVDFNTYLSS